MKDKSEKDEAIRLTVREFLLSFVDINVTLLDIADPHNFYKRPINSYQKWREGHATQFNNLVCRMKKKGLVKSDEDNFALTKSGKEKIKNYLLNNISLAKNIKWNGKWMMLMFDIPDIKRKNRRLFANKLREMGFIKLQESVYVYPFECKEEIKYICNFFEIEKFVITIIAEKIDNEKKLIDTFINHNVLGKEYTI